MTQERRTYCCIDLKSFYASVECVARNLDPLQARLVVADPERSEKTICLAVSPALKKLGIPGRCRVFEIPKGISYIMAKPHMKRYMEVSAQIVGIYLRYVSEQDLHVYSIDECFIDLTPYINLYKKNARELVDTLRNEVLKETGIPASAGIGSNLFLAKVALDVTAKHVSDNVGILTERSFRERIWPHRPITDIWQIGKGIARHLERFGIYDMDGVAHANIDTLYREFGINAEYLVDHAWGVEPCTIAEIKAYRPQATSLSNGQVLPFDYSFEEARMILREMVDESVLKLVEKRMVTNHISLFVGYRKDPNLVPRARVSRKLLFFSNSFERLFPLFDQLFCKIVDPNRPLRRISIGLGNIIPEHLSSFDLFGDIEKECIERKRQETLIAIKQRFGKAAIMKGTSLKDKARGFERAHQVGGHNA